MAGEQFTTISITKQQKGITEGMQFKSGSEKHQVDSLLGRKILCEAAMASFTNLLKEILSSVLAIIMTSHSTNL